ncbi:E3 ubiquitin-protein ligase MARCHF8-like [Haliotis rubra]|uniref:E3 ubiquitin-protein ligase MARCHF8-like n=1 Tax=Haliotis rubra TaxID=36100 RepID=UPI001EE51693|nr:E3 ubiquitin-protein ligase MARCHF8-like [Haliotis rubra]
MSLSPIYFEPDNNEDYAATELLEVPKKKTARRSLESQFETCIQEKPVTPQPTVGVEQQVNVQLPKETIESSLSDIVPHGKDHDAMNEMLPTRLFQQVLPATSTESIGSASSYRQRSKSPTRTPSFCAAISASLMSLEEEIRKKEADMLASRNKLLKIKSSTPKSIASLPPSPQVPNQTSTPAPDQIISMSTSQCNTSESDSVVCRICHDGDSSEELVSPCYCTGSVGALHLTCLERWLGTSNTTKCEICKYEFKVERKPRPIIEFLRHPASASDRKNLACDLVCFIVLTPLTVCSAFLCLMGVKHYSQWSGQWEVPGLASLTACLLTVYTIWCCVAVKHHIQVVTDWRKKNQIIKIIYLSPTKGKTVLHTETVCDVNNNARSPAQTPISHSANTPRSSQCRELPQDTPKSYNTAMLKPILKYSVNLQAYSHPSGLDTTGASVSHTILWGGTDSMECSSNPIMITRATSSQMMAVLGKETYV